MGVSKCKEWSKAEQRDLAKRTEVSTNTVKWIECFAVCASIKCEKFLESSVTLEIHGLCKDGQY
mgnify:CR=1 FL=1